MQRSRQAHSKTNPVNLFRCFIYNLCAFRRGNSKYIHSKRNDLLQNIQAQDLIETGINSKVIELYSIKNPQIIFFTKIQKVVSARTCVIHTTYFSEQERSKLGRWARSHPPQP